ncbi:hypothetical protein F511_43111 [Dorcoceras hygrometricum]|uniref:Uncharacterized protein n=1 Tax=Dorcoceras hygrometricum TaxID=472368 RepID=A0A2Z7CEG2_9LAMI|nr:hypothetical protein F511_43111 [Dorcoceras hygrometricum]
MLTQKLKLIGETHDTDFYKSSEHQQLHASTPALIQGSKWVEIERANLGESSATKIVKNRGWKRRESAVESYAIERSKLGESNTTKIVKNRGRKRRELAVESYGEQYQVEGFNREDKK